MSNIISAVEYAKILEQKYVGLKVPIYKLREWFATEQKIFFDCESPDKTACLSQILAKPDFPAFIIYLVVKDASTDNYDFMDVGFRNLMGLETLQHFINRYHAQLESMTKLSLQGVGREYVESVGHGYEEKML
ncbi:MAG: hypothetical protein ACUVT5_01880 [Candidatus Bathyarchaeales archaeon]